MKIISCHIDSFGLFTDFDIDFERNLNVILEDNGWGKTTLATFIKSMFYGMPAKGRNKDFVATRSRYLSWNGTGLYGGNLVFEMEKKKYKVIRHFGLQPDKDTFEIYDLSTMLKVNTFTQNLGYELFGVGEDTFEMTVFFPQNSLTSGINDDIRANLSGLASAKQDDMDNFSRANVALNKKAKELKSVLAKQVDIETIEYKLEENNENLTLYYDKIQKINEEKSVLLNNNKDLEVKFKNLCDLEEEFNVFLQEENKCKEKIEILNENLNEVKDNAENLKKDVFEKEKIDRYEQINKKLKIKDEEYKSNKLKNLYIYFGFALLFLIIAIALIVLMGFSVITALVLVVAILSFTPFGIMLYKYIKESRFKLEEEDEAFFSNLNYDIDDISDALNEYRERLIKYNAVLEEISKKEGDIQKLEDELKEIEAQKIKKFGISTEELGNQKNDVSLSINKNDKEIAVLENEIKNLKNNTDRLENDLQDNNELLDVKRVNVKNCEEKLNLLNKTMSYLETAKNNLSIKFLRPLNLGFNKYFEKLDLKKNTIGFDVDLNMKLETNNSYKEIEFLSLGYQDMIYFCKRLALNDLVYKKEKPFLILDDPFINLDDKKIETANNILKELSKDYQIIYFTCSKQRKMCDK